MSKYKSYPKYKDSGVEWLGQMPEGWKAVQLKHICRFAYGDALSQDVRCEGSTPVYGSNGIVDVHDTPNTKAPALIVGRKGSFGKVSYSEKSAFVIDTAYFIDVSTTVYPLRWIYYMLQTLELDAVSKDTGVPGLSREDAYSKIAPLPNDKEFDAISAFLDHETSHIDTIISKQEHLVDLLEEKRVSIISHAVTKGLNPDVPMKDSDIGWIGAAPKHWDLIRIKHLFAIKKRIAGTLGFDVLSITQKGIQIKDLEANTGQFSMDYSKYQLVERGDFAMNHMDLLTGFVDISNYEGVTSPDYRVFSLLDRKNYVALYFLYIFQNAYLNKIFYSLGQGVSHFGRWRLQTEQFNDFVLPVPPKDEQKAIVDYLEGELSKIDAIINKTRQTIALAKERRAAIISAAVTGKICVCRPQSVEKPLSKSLEYFQKVVLAAEITDQLHMERTFGRVKLQKILYLSEYHAQLPFQRSEYQRYAAGPHDPKAMYSIEGQMKKQKWFDSRLRESGYGKEYVPLERHEAYKPYYERYFAEKHEVIQRIIDLLRTKDTQFCEVVATLYGIWNDFLLEGQQLDDAAMFREAVTNWAPEKKKVPPGLWPKALHWMRENNLVPSGWGEPTIHRQKA
ncbi:restriction endonuclease subunit S [Desulfovibrio sp. OttesenSCG-928-O18]|nr:restriction endonuclease subunit S [Desulfovibrio sp. OttesenSCG-928-O18]